MTESAFLELKQWHSLFSFIGPESQYTKTAQEIVNVCYQTLTEVSEKEDVPVGSNFLESFCSLGLREAFSAYPFLKCNIPPQPSTHSLYSSLLYFLTQH